MTRMIIAVSLIALAMSGCAYPEQQASAPMNAQPETISFTQDTCGRCHAIEGDALSPNPQAPRFVDIANREWMTQESLASWLADAHNYPEMMEVDLERDRVDAIAAYMLTLRSDDYKRLPD